jgi:fibronectin type 3 domain-containing protein
MIYERMIKTALLLMGAMFIFCCTTFSQTDSTSNSTSNSPSNLLATADGNVVSLTWQAPEGESTITYNIYRAMVPATMSGNKDMDSSSGSNPSIDPTKLDFKKISTATETSYEDKIEDVPEGGQEYVYYVVAVDNKGMESAGTNYVTVNVGVSKTQSMVQ